MSDALYGEFRPIATAPRDEIMEARDKHSKRDKYKPRPVVYVDVDGTLLINGQPNDPLIDSLGRMKAKGLELILWSARGETHARTAASLTCTTHLYSHILSKPGYIVDDKGWRGKTR